MNIEGQRRLNKYNVIAFVLCVRRSEVKSTSLSNYKQLWDEIEQDIQKYSYRGQCHLTKAEADNIE